MHLVALTRWNAGGLEAELPALAKLLGLALYDARLRLAGGLPVVLQRGLAAADAQRAVAGLRARGLGAIECALDALVPVAALRTARSFKLDASACSFSDDRGETRSFAYAALHALVRAVEQTELSQTLETKEKKFALGRAVMSGGVMLNKTVTKSESSAKEEQQQVAFLFERGNAAPMVLKEHALGYEGLGNERGTIARKSFEALIGRLRSAAPQALFDSRMLNHKRKLELESVRGTSNERTVSNSNAGPNALAAQLLVRAQLEGQL